MLSYFTIINKRPSFYEGLFIWKLSKMKQLIIFLLFVSFFNQANAQSEHKQTKQQRKAEQKKEQQARASIKAEEKGRKHHISIQSKDVKKRMKRNPSNEIDEKKKAKTKKVSESTLRMQIIESY